MDHTCKTVEQIALRDRMHRLVKDAYKKSDLSHNELRGWLMAHLEDALNSEGSYQIDDAIPDFSEDDRNPPTLSDDEINDIANQENSTVVKLKP